ncbi:uncharacterized protein LOC113330115 [Papaver somniferum]|uniref:uncharacterized protein LOC113330115 n=1 Tax=Papaver somniferum TaxID=3469 RepID=UPI000E6F638B|nr:uncharacterized protein LOC113330115 [Papaver somniferum]
MDYAQKELSHTKFASIIPGGDNFQGAHAEINIWKPLTEQPYEFSASQIWISHDNGQEVIEAGSQEDSTANWWLLFQNTLIGYWPNFIFKQLSVKATKIAFGGQVSNTQPNGRHTNTQMGSGHMPVEGGFAISSFFHEVQVLDGNRESITPNTVSVVRTKPGCYDLKLDKKDSSGIKFYYGGLGFSDTCK